MFRVLRPKFHQRVAVFFRKHGVFCFGGNLCLFIGGGGGEKIAGADFCKENIFDNPT